MSAALSAAAERARMMSPVSIALSITWIVQPTRSPLNAAHSVRFMPL